MDQFTAQVMLHEEAVYLQDGAQFHVEQLDWEEKKAYVRPVDVDYYTDALLGVSVNVLDTFEHEPLAGLDRSHGEVKLTALATKFKKIRFHTHENVGSGPINLPEQTLHTTAYWTTVEPDLWAALGREQLEAGLQGMAHAMRSVASLRLMCDPRDLGALGEVRSTATRRPTVTIYEVYPGGVGYASRLFELHAALLSGAAELVRQCPCAAGCPSCVGPLGGVDGAKEACLKLLCGTVFAA
jgi:DEAD/DEAH box helicase domain-containing protein